MTSFYMLILRGPHCQPLEVPTVGAQGSFIARNCAIRFENLDVLPREIQLDEDGIRGLCFMPDAVDTVLN